MEIFFKKHFFIKAILIFVVFFLFFTFSLLDAYSLEQKQEEQNSLNNETKVENSENVLDKEAERKKLEEQLKELEKQIEEHQKKITEYQKKGKTLSNEINILNSQINQLNLQISAINIKLKQLSSNVNETQSRIREIEKQIDTNKEALASALRILYESQSQGLLEIFLANNNFSDFFVKLDNLVLVQNNMRTYLKKIEQLRNQLIIQRQTLEEKLAETETFRNIQLAQKKTLQQTQSYKNQLLKETKGQESEYQKLLKKTKETAAEIRNRIFQLLGGGELTFKQAYDYAKLASGATGVRAALILAVLDRESALGRNVGKCSYKTAMHPTRDVPIFLKILEELKFDPESKSVYVSCPNQHGTYGGAMGPAQFIPSTWVLYKDKVSQITGNKPANPWNNADAFVATGLFLRDLMNSDSCVSYSGGSRDLKEQCAAAKYYAGSSWYSYRLWYGQAVVNKANKFEDDIKTMLSTG